MASGTTSSASPASRTPIRTTVYLSPGVRVGVDRFSGFVSFGVPVVNQHNGVQSKPDFRVLTGIGARLN